MPITKTAKELIDSKHAPVIAGTGAALGTYLGTAMLGEASLASDVTIDQNKNLVSKLKNIGGHKGPLVVDYNAGHNAVVPKAIQQIQGSKNPADYMMLGNSKAGTAHEMGHLTGKLSRNIPYQRLHMLSRGASLRGLTSLAGSGLAATHEASNEPSEKVKNLAKYAPGVIAAPMIAEEARATARGLNMLRKAEGMGSAVRAAPRLGGALATYGSLAAMPLVASHFAKKYKKYKDK